MGDGSRRSGVHRRSSRKRRAAHTARSPAKCDGVRQEAVRVRSSRNGGDSPQPISLSVSEVQADVFRGPILEDMVRGDVASTRGDLPGLSAKPKQGMKTETAKQEIKADRVKRETIKGEERSVIARERRDTPSGIGDMVGGRVENAQSTPPRGEDQMKTTRAQKTMATQEEKIRGCWPSRNVRAPSHVIGIDRSYLPGGVGMINETREQGEKPEYRRLIYRQRGRRIGSPRRD